MTDPLPKQFSKDRLKASFFGLLGLHILSGVIAERMLSDNVNSTDAVFWQIKDRLLQNNRNWIKSNEVVHRAIRYSVKVVYQILRWLIQTLEMQKTGPMRRASDWEDIIEEMDSMSSESSPSPQTPKPGYGSSRAYKD